MIPLLLLIGSIVLMVIAGKDTVTIPQRDWFIGWALYWLIVGTGCTLRSAIDSARKTILEEIIRARLYGGKGWDKDA